MAEFKINEIMGRPDFPDLLSKALQPTVIEGAELEPNQWKELFQTVQMNRYSMDFLSFGGLSVGRITEGQEIPFVNLGYGRTSVRAEDYGVRLGFTHQMLRDEEYDLMTYSTREAGKGYARTQNAVAFALIQSGGTDLDSEISSASITDLAGKVRYCLTYGLTNKEDGVVKPIAYDTIVINPVDVASFAPAKVEDAVPGIVFDPVTGRLTGIMGLKVVVTPYITAGEVYVLKAKDELLYLEREAMTVDRTERFETACEEVRLMGAFTFACLNAKKIVHFTK